MITSPYPPPLAFGVGDFVRCVSAVGWPDGTFPLQVGHVYQVRAIEQAGDFDAAAVGKGPLVYVHGHPRGFLPFRFVLTVKAPANDDPCAAAAVPQLMARTMRECLALTGACTVDDLARAGFTSAQIIEFSDEARGLAGPVSDCAAGEVA